MNLPITPGVKVEASLAAVWTDLTRDVDNEAGLSIRYGIEANGPLEGVADPGECTFALQNWAKPAIGRPQGYYAPLHASVRSGWTWGVPLRISLRDPTTGIWHTKHRGKTRVIDPVAGLYAARLVPVVSQDGMIDLDEADVRGLAIETGKTETELITAVLDALAAEAQPVARDLDVGVDTFAYAFHDLGDGVKATELINDIATDAYAFIFMKGDGTFVLRNRHTRVEGVSAGLFTDLTLHGFTAPSDLNQAYNLVRVTISPPTIDAAATTVLYADQSVRSVTAGQTVEFWVSYRDPDESKTLIGGLDVVTPLEDGVDYAGNSQADGLGADLTGSLAITVTAFGSAALVSIENLHQSVTIYLVNGSGDPFLQIRGKGVYDLGPTTYEASSTQPYGVRELKVTLRYQDDPGVAQSYADYLEAQRHSLARQPQTVAFVANTSAALMTHALAREPGDIITVTEAMTGFTAVEAVIQSVELLISKGAVIVCRWGLAPTAPYKSWQLGVAGRTALGAGQTILGF